MSSIVRRLLTLLRLEGERVTGGSTGSVNQSRSIHDGFGSFRCDSYELLRGAVASKRRDLVRRDRARMRTSALEPSVRLDGSWLDRVDSVRESVRHAGDSEEGRIRSTNY